MAVPSGFSREVQTAEAGNDDAKLTLLGLEAQWAPWRSAGVRLAEEALGRIAPPAPCSEAILFTGHRIDAPDRPTPRFPASKEPEARAAIRQVLEKRKDGLGIAGGANGGDILFLELCRELGIPSEMRLALPAGPFAEESVKHADGNWEARFQALLREHPGAPVLADSQELPDWLRFKQDYDIWQRNNLWLLSAALSHKAKRLTIVALWDGKTGDGPGGTEHMAGMAEQRGAEVIHLKTTEIFGLEGNGA